VLAGRMVRDYVERLYAPASAAARSISAEGYQGAKDLAAWKLRVAKAWPGVSVDHVESSLESGDADSPHVGTRLTIRALVDVGELAPGDVAVEAVYGGVDETDSLVSPAYWELTGDEVTDDGRLRYAGEIPLDRTGAFGYSVRVVPSHERLATRAELGLVALPPAPVGMPEGDLR
jgi:hypothetical protein